MYILRILYIHMRNCSTMHKQTLLVEKQYLWHTTMTKIRKNTMPSPNSTPNTYDYSIQLITSSLPKLSQRGVKLGGIPTSANDKDFERLQSVSHDNKLYIWTILYLVDVPATHCFWGTPSAPKIQNGHAVLPLDLMATIVCMVLAVIAWHLGGTTTKPYFKKNSWTAIHVQFCCDQAWCGWPGLAATHTYISPSASDRSSNCALSMYCSSDRSSASGNLRLAKMSSIIMTRLSAAELQVTSQAQPILFCGKETVLLPTMPNVVWHPALNMNRWRAGMRLDFLTVMTCGIYCSCFNLVRNLKFQLVPLLEGWCSKTYSHTPQITHLRTQGFTCACSDKLAHRHVEAIWGRGAQVVARRGSFLL